MRVSASAINKISLFVKILITIACIGYLFIKIFQRDDFPSIVEQVAASIENGKTEYLLLAMLLTSVNWLLETFKWQMMMAPIEKLSVSQALKGVLAGVSIGVFTPNRVGEFSGRIFHLKTNEKLTATLYTWLCSTSQLAITIITGITAVILYKYSTANTNEVLQLSHFITNITAILLIAIVIVVYFNLHLAYRVILKKSFFKNLTGNLQSLKKISRVLLAKVLTLSGVRHLVFSLQFYLLLLFFGINTDPLSSFIMIWLSFISATIIPTLAFTELSVRGTTALIFIGQLSSDTTSIIAASFTLWTINIALPATAGLFFIPAMKLHKE